MTSSYDIDGREPATVPPVGLSGWSRRSRIAVAAVTVLALIVLGAAVRWAASASHHTTGSGAQRAAPPNQTEIASVMQLLGEHASALRNRDDPAWSAGIDGTGGDFAQHQAALFDNLAKVPLTTWRYVLIAPVTDPTVLGPAADRLNGRVAVLHVRLQYALAQVDPTPTGKDQWLTAVRRPAGWRLAGDSDAARTGGLSWRGPWDFGPLTALAGPHTLVLAHPSHSSDAVTFQRLVEQSVPVVAGVWGGGWNEHIGVLIPDSTEEFTAVSGDGSDSHDIAAIAIADAVTGGGAAGSVQGARIVLNPANLSRLDAVGRRLVVQHELTHIATRTDTSDQMPTWLIEGFADYVGNLGSSQPVKQAAQELTAEIRRGLLPARLPVDADFGGGNSRLAQIYEQSWLACRLIAASAGQAALVQFYRVVSAAAGTDPSSAAAAGFDHVLHTSAAAFTARWRADLRARLR